MNPTAKAVVFLLVILGLAGTVTSGSLLPHGRLTAILDGSQPPVPPKLVCWMAHNPLSHPSSRCLTARSRLFRPRWRRPL